MKLSFSKISNFRRLKTTAFGMDISDNSIKIVQLKQSKKGLVIDVSLRESLPAGAIVDGEIKNVQAVTNKLREIVNNKKLPLVGNVVASLPEARTFMQTIKIAKKGEESLEERVMDVLPEYLPFDIDEVYFDSLLVEEDEKTWRVVIGAAPKQGVDILLQILDATNLLPLTLDLEMAAVANALIPETKEESTPRAIIDLGATRASLLLHDYNSPQFTMEVEISGKEITQEIAKQLEMTPEEAESAKISCGLDPQKCEGVLRKILEAQVTEATKQIATANEYYRTHFSYGRPIQEVILSGGGAHLLELDTVLSKVLNVPVKIGDPLKTHNIEPQPQMENADFTVATGLALRGLTQ